MDGELPKYLGEAGKPHEFENNSSDDQLFLFSGRFCQGFAQRLFLQGEIGYP